MKSNRWLNRNWECPCWTSLNPFSEEPIASASIGQVHRGVLLPNMAAGEGLDGEHIRDVVIKVRHTGIERVIETDLDILAGLAQLAERLEDFRNYQPTVIVKEMSRIMRRELDFEREKRNLNQFRAQFEDEPLIEMPVPISHFVYFKSAHDVPIGRHQIERRTGSLSRFGDLNPASLPGAVPTCT